MAWSPQGQWEFRGPPPPPPPAFSTTQLQCLLRVFSVTLDKVHCTQPFIIIFALAQYDLNTVDRPCHRSSHPSLFQKRLQIGQFYPIYSAIRQVFPHFRITTANKIRPMKFCYNMSYYLPKQSQRSRFILQDRSRFFGMFWREKTLL